MECWRGRLGRNLGHVLGTAPNVVNSGRPWPKKRSLEVYYGIERHVINGLLTTPKKM